MQIVYGYVILKADTLFFITKVIYLLDMLISYILCAVFASQNCLLWCAETKRHKCIQEN